MEASKRTQLISRVTERIHQLDDELSTSVSIPDKKLELADDASANLDLTISAPVEEKLLSEHRAERQQLERNLIWLDSDDAGYCVQCGDEIPVARLEAVLNTRQCVVCAEASNR